MNGRDAGFSCRRRLLARGQQGSHQQLRNRWKFSIAPTGCQCGDTPLDCNESLRGLGNRGEVRRLLAPEYIGAHSSWGALLGCVVYQPGSRCAEGQSRTGDTGIFSAVLYHLSYLGIREMVIHAPVAVKARQPPTSRRRLPGNWESGSVFAIARHAHRAYNRCIRPEKGEAIYAEQRFPGP